jgi:nicotinate-nucleotide adenylyltransferase
VWCNTRAASPEPLALFGGTFDPVHYGHLRCAEQARRVFGLECLYLLPAGQPPHRLAPLATTPQRLEMLHLAQAEFPQLAIDDRETRRDGPSFMVDTLGELRSENPGRALVLLLGQDAMNGLHRWREWQQLFTLAHIVTFPRPGAYPDYAPELAVQLERRGCASPGGLLAAPAGGFLHLDLELVDISATEIQAIIRHGDSPRGMLPEKVLAYIDESALYRSV